jgi:hypothetical protein
VVLGSIARFLVVSLRGNQIPFCLPVPALLPLVFVAFTGLGILFCAFVAAIDLAGGGIAGAIGGASDER